MDIIVYIACGNREYLEVIESEETKRWFLKKLAMTEVEWPAYIKEVPYTKSTHLNTKYPNHILSDFVTKLFDSRRSPAASLMLDNGTDEVYCKLGHLTF